MTLFPGRPAQVGPAHNAQSPILAYVLQFSPQQSAFPPRPKRSTAFIAPDSPRRRSRAAHNLIQHLLILRAEPSPLEQLRPVALSLLQRAAPPPLPYRLMVSAQQNFRHIPPAKRWRPRVMGIIENAVIHSGRFRTLGRREIRRRCAQDRSHAHTRNRHLTERLIHTA